MGALLRQATLWAGTAFCGAWLIAILLFPPTKGMLSGYAAVAVGLGLASLLLQEDVRARLLRSESTSSARFLIWLLITGVALRIGAVFFFPMEPMVDDAQFHRYATGLLGGAGYGVPGYRAWFPPGMSFVLAGWYFITTPTPLSGKMLQILISAVLIWQTWATAREWTSEGTARIAAILVALLPSLVFYTATLGYEPLLALIFLIACRYTVRLARSARIGVIQALAIGAILGVGSLVKPTCLLVPFLCAVAWAAADNPWRLVLVRFALVLAGLVVVVAPWTIRNYRTLGAFVPVSTNGGTTLYSANNPNATGLAMNVDPVPGEFDEVSRDRARMSAAVHWITGHPGQTLRLALTKMTYTWGTASSIMSVVSTDRLPPSIETACKAILNVTWVTLAVLCAFATLKVRPWGWIPFVPATLVVVYLFTTHLFYEGLSRYHLPVLPLLAIVGALAIAPPATSASRR